MRKLLLLLLSIGLFWATARAQNPGNFQERFRIQINKSAVPLEIDGVFTEEAWLTATAANNFREKWPNDQDMAKQQTEIKLTYDQKFLYIAVTAWQKNPLIVQTLKRDNGIYESDAVSIAIDPVNQKTNGFLFSINPFNVQTEDLVYNNAGDNMSFSWDNKWYSSTKRFEDHWTAEIAIPFSTLRFTSDKTVWGINFFRADIGNNQYSSWTHMPVNFPFFDFGYSGALVWDQPPPVPGSNISIVPYVSGSASTDNVNSNSKLSGGVDAKIAITPSLNLDLTVNPDFSQVEVDKQVTNLTRFNLFFPEKRTFFLENDDLFSGFGISPIKPFYSRRIGLDNDGNTIPIAGGVRLSGNLNKKLRVGVMNMQSLKKGDFTSQNYTAVTFNQQVQARSIVKGYFLNRQETGSSTTYPEANPLNEFGRNFGLEYNFIDVTGKWNAWTGYHRSFKPGINSHEHFIDLGFGYTGKKFSSVTDLTDLTSNYYTDMGYIERIENYDAKLDTSFRLGFKHFFNETFFKIFPESNFINTHTIGMENYIVWNPDNTLNERQLEVYYLLELKNTRSLRVAFGNAQTNLRYYTSFTENEPLAPGTYKYNQVGLKYNSDFRRKFYYSTELLFGGFYSGEIAQAGFTGNLRVQPWGNFSIDIRYSSLRFPEPTGSEKLLLVAPRIEINFSNKIFWTTFIQYNNQRNNINFNSRLQWRYKPMSDIFLVYTDNYFTDPLFKNKSRGIVFKMNYWLNL